MSSGTSSRQYRRRKQKSSKSDLSDPEEKAVEVTSGTTGGYDLDFVEEPDKDLTCSICHLVLRDPHLTSCCGSHFCQSCVAAVLSAWSPCPLCKSSSFSTFLDKSFQRKVNELEILCPRSNDGCEWNGTVGSVGGHVDVDCMYVEIECELCSDEIQRGNYVDHKADMCTKRPFTCEYCGYSKTWVDVTSKHYKKCGKFPVQCPNMCGIGMIERKNLGTHVKALCPLQVEPCPFEFAGCGTQSPRKDSEAHVSTNSSSHVTLLAGVCADYKRRLDVKEQEVKDLQTTVVSLTEVIKAHESMIHGLSQKISQLQVSKLNPSGPLLAPPSPVVVFPPADLYLRNLQFFKQTNKKWMSGPFYTHPGGYKMCLTVFANGIGKSKNSQMHISVFANLMRGEFDNELEWPFQGEVFVSLHLESSEDIVKTLMFGPKSHYKAIHRVTEGEVSEFGQGEFHFAHHSKLGLLNNLHFTVFRVNWKPTR